MNAPQPPYTRTESTAISESQTMRDLRIKCNDKSFHIHITEMATQYRQLAEWILRLLRARYQEISLTRWRAFVLSCLDDCFQLWSRHNTKLAVELEGIQCYSTEKIVRVVDEQQRERLRKLLYFWERRRETFNNLHMENSGSITNFGFKYCTNA